MTDTKIQELFDVGAHYGYTRSKRHPSAERHIFGSKDRNDIFDLEKTAALVEDAKEFVGKLAGDGKKVLFVGGKHEALSIVREAAEKIGVLYVSGRWIGGTLTNIKEIRKRVNRMTKLRKERDSGERDQKYTKLERLMQDREIEDLERKFGGIVEMEERPSALFVVDPRHEETAVREANRLGIPVIALANSDCDFDKLQYPIPANDSSVKSIRYFVDVISEAYEEGKKSVGKKEE